MSVKLGQNFLINIGIAEKIVSELFPITETVLEIGPGKGILTNMIVRNAEIQNIDLDLVLVEIDIELSKELKNKADDYKVITKSILDLLPIDFENKTVHLIGNVPYYISKEIINWIIKNNKYIKSGVLMFQKEFVDKLLKINERKTKNPQALIFNYLFGSKRLTLVNPGSFFPSPKVSSSVFKFARKKDTVVDIDAFYNFLKICFNNRRKTLMNNLSQEYSQNTLKILEENNLNIKTRAEELETNDFIKIYRSLLD